MFRLDNLSDKKLHIFRYLSYWLYVACTIGIPIILISWQFDIFKKPGIGQLTIWGIILVIVLAFIFKGHLNRAISEMETSILKTILINFSKLVPWIIFWFALTFLDDTIHRFKFVLWWSIVGNILAMFIDIYHTATIKECENRKPE